MTRINSAISPACLTDEHLLAEHREIKRICTFAGKTYPNAPKEFTLGTGHILFFADKPFFTYHRYISLYHECKRRDFNIENYSGNWEKYDVLSVFAKQDHVPTAKEHALLVDRITERLLNTKKPYWHYYGKRITKQQAIDLL